MARRAMPAPAQALWSISSGPQFIVVFTKPPTLANQWVGGQSRTTNKRAPKEETAGGLFPNRGGSGGQRPPERATTATTKYCAAKLL